MVAEKFGRKLNGAGTRESRLARSVSARGNEGGVGRVQELATTVMPTRFNIPYLGEQFKSLVLIQGLLFRGQKRSGYQMNEPKNTIGWHTVPR